MLRAVLLDLDDTLLQNDMAVFVPRYLDSLGSYADSRHPKQDLIAAVLTSTQAMLSNTDPKLTNREVFWATFEPLTDLSQAANESFFERFYHEAYPSLRAVTSPVAGAQALVEACLSRGLQVVIATNPVYPAAGIVERLRWAGFESDPLPFSLITSYENMHATKPHRAYYREILQRVGCRPAEALMVGNDPDADISPARDEGLNTFLVCSRTSQVGVTSACGSLEHLRHALADGWLTQPVA